tara:strand:- start:27 stop:1076 length:1050 start_codon:yes stop_codon:yes gene_type:complete
MRSIFLSKIIDIHKVNVIGLGADKFSTGIVNNLIRSEQIQINNIYENKKNSSNFLSFDKTKIKYVDYKLGNFSRLFEIIFWSFLNHTTHDILVLGDLPLNTSSQQYVLCHQSLMFTNYSKLNRNYYKYLLFRLIFKRFLKKNDIVVVQSKVMASKVRRFFGRDINIKIIDIKHESYEWPEFKRTKRFSNNNDRFNLFYPSADYPHKNHDLLSQLKINEKFQIKVTIDSKNIYKAKKNIKFLGSISREEVYNIYKSADALLFLSSEESFGLPIAEAVKCNIPIICPIADYTKFLSSQNCFYFKLSDPISLIDAIDRLENKLKNNWWSNWDFNVVYSNDEFLTIDKIILGD